MTNKHKLDKNFIDSLQNLVAKISEVKYHIKNQKTDHVLFFRGESKRYPDTQLVPKIYRKFKDTDISYIRREHEIIREAVLRNPKEFENCKSTFEILAKM